MGQTSTALAPPHTSPGFARPGEAANSLRSLVCRSAHSTLSSLHQDSPVLCSQPRPCHCSHRKLAELCLRAQHKSTWAKAEFSVTQPAPPHKDWGDIPRQKAKSCLYRNHIQLLHQHCQHHGNQESSCDCLNLRKSRPAGEPTTQPYTPV